MLPKFHHFSHYALTLFSIFFGRTGEHCRYRGQVVFAQFNRCPDRWTPDPRGSGED
jgi:hypothetical protein